VTKPTSIGLFLLAVGLITANEAVIAADENVTFKVLRTEPLESLCEKLRPQPPQVWSGADAAYSIRLSNNQALWFFGDTFLCRAGQPLRMVNNSAARQRLDQNGTPLEFAWGKGDSSLFPANKYWLWPLDGCELNGRVYEFMNVVESRRSRDPNFAFRARYQLLMQLNNPEAPMPQWSYSTTACKARGVQLGNAVYRDANFLYVYSSSLKDARGNARHPIMLARIALTELEDMRPSGPAIEYYCGAPFTTKERKNWRRSPAQATILFFDGAPEMSVTEIPGRKGLFAFYFPPGFGDTIMMRHSERPEGPWSEPQAIYKCPEDMKRFFVYSAKAHPEQLQHPGEITLTYCVNAIAVDRHGSLPPEPASYYYPRAIRVVLGESAL
jgi:hypothetical protein